MSIIYKYEIKETVCIPKSAIILDCQLQNGVPVFWALIGVNREDLKTLHFKVLPTGGEFDSHDLLGYKHFATIQDNSGFVWHNFVKEE